MQESSVMERIKSLCRARSWTVYRLAKESGIPYSTLNTMLNKSNSPSIPTLSRICDGFGLTLSQFFSDEDGAAPLTSEQKAHMTLWDQLDPRGKHMATGYIQALLDIQQASGARKKSEDGRPVP